MKEGLLFGFKGLTLSKGDSFVLFRFSLFCFDLFLFLLHAVKL